MPKIYFLGGLGLDNSIVNDISLAGNELCFIDWERPLPKDTLESYSSRLISKYGIDNGSVIIGVSFGGLIAIEIAKKLALKKVVLVSSFSDPKVLSWFFRAAISLRLYFLFPPSILRYFSFVLNYFFSVSSSSDAAVLSGVIRRTDPIFLNWAIGNILKFTPPKKVIKTVRIHGDSDRIIRIDRQNTEYIVPKAGHFMIYDRKKDVALILEKAIS